MFTGIVEEVGVIERREDCNIAVAASRVLEGIQDGDSIAIDGACMTVVSFTNNGFAFQVSPESFDKTTLGTLEAGSKVNLERAMSSGDRFGGHIVQGHVDGLGQVERIQKQQDFSLWTFSMPEQLSRYLIPKGSITVNGISLTVVDPSKDGFDVAIIPRTLQETTLHAIGPGAQVNIEIDIFSKHVFHYMKQTGILPPDQEIHSASTLPKQENE